MQRGHSVVELHLSNVIRDIDLSRVAKVLIQSIACSLLGLNHLR